jgi:hypothetical protein
MGEPVISQMHFKESQINYGYLTQRREGAKKNQGKQTQKFFASLRLRVKN